MMTEPQAYGFCFTPVMASLLTRKPDQPVRRVIRATGAVTGKATSLVAIARESSVIALQVMPRSTLVNRYAITLFKYSITTFVIAMMLDPGSLFPLNRTYKKTGALAPVFTHYVSITEKR
ncbi:hypothetical protein J4G63_10920 [Aeromonas sobria]|uniref:hypothetical protein n=1 Tax=Aeromonas sobria TaxID=646 RepID=UPI001114AAA9|nr:hypothetical protein [Aeromonas sobria]MBS4687749.1 hypothetical protein [Aeromonas sobria]